MSDIVAADRPFAMNARAAPSRICSRRSSGDRFTRFFADAFAMTDRQSA
jgi:hypothetical protein